MGVDGHFMSHTAVGQWVIQRVKWKAPEGKKCYIGASWSLVLSNIHLTNRPNLVASELIDTSAGGTKLYIKSCLLEQSNNGLSPLKTSSMGGSTFIDSYFKGGSELILRGSSNDLRIVINRNYFSIPIRAPVGSVDTALIDNNIINVASDGPAILALSASRFYIRNNLIIQTSSSANAGGVYVGNSGFSQQEFIVANNYIVGANVGSGIYTDWHKTGNPDTAADIAGLVATGNIIRNFSTGVHLRARAGTFTLNVVTSNQIVNSSAQSVLVEAAGQSTTSAHIRAIVANNQFINSPIGIKFINSGIGSTINGVFDPNHSVRITTKVDGSSQITSDESIFIKRDGTTPLSGNWTVGNFDIGYFDFIAKPSSLYVKDTAFKLDTGSVVTTVGKTAVGGSTYTFPANNSSAAKVVLTSTAKVTAISAYTWANVAGRGVYFGIYDNNAGTPNNLLASTSGTLPTAASWLTLNLPNPIILSPGTYWIAVLPNVGAGVTVSWAYDAGAAGSSWINNPDTYSDGLENPWSGGSSSTNDFSAYLSVETVTASNITFDINDYLSYNRQNDTASLKIANTDKFIWKPSGYTNTAKAILQPVTQTISAAGDTVVSTAELVKVTPNANITLTSTPSISDGEADGQRLYILNDSAVNTLTLQDESVLPGSNVRGKGGANVVIGPKEVVEFVWNATYTEWTVI